MLTGQQIGPFEIEKELGSGAMGTVYRAKFRRSEDKVITVALKVVALGLLGNEGAMARFDREANILKQLKHPHIVRLIAHGKINKQNPYIAMEYIDGEALDRVLARRGKMSWEDVANLGKQLAEALQYAHDKGIIHRDLKPSNLMMTREGVLKLTDFGIAKDTDVTALTGANSTIGTAAYMSPEQCKGDKGLSNKSDLYSLGVVFFELLSGRKPFTAETTVEMFLKHVNEKPPRIGKLVNELPPKFESLIMQLLEKERDDRPVDAAWVARMLRDIEEDAFARKSAGLSVAEARTAKPMNQGGERMSAADKEAARTLRGKKKKTKKKEEVPFIEKKWVRATGLVLILAVLAFGAYSAIKSPSAEKMYAAIEKANSPEAKAEAAAKFLEAHGAKGGEQVDKAAAIFREAKIREREKQLTNRVKGKFLKPTENDDPEAYSNTMQAMEAEQTGQFDVAIALWEKVKSRFPEEAKLPYTTKEEQLTKARWAWVAEKRISDIALARTELVRIRKKIEDSKPIELSLKGDPGNPETTIIRVIRLRQFGDHERAATECDLFTKRIEDDSDKRAWYLLGSQIRTTIPKGAADPVENRKMRIIQWLDAAQTEADAVKGTPETEAGAARRDVRNRCREVIELYDEDSESDIAKLVQRARTIAAMVPKNS